MCVIPWFEVMSWHLAWCGVPCLGVSQRWLWLRWMLFWQTMQPNLYCNPVCSGRNCFETGRGFLETFISSLIWWYGAYDLMVKPMLGIPFVLFVYLHFISYPAYSSSPSLTSMRFILWPLEHLLKINLFTSTSGYILLTSDPRSWPFGELACLHNLIYLIHYCDGRPSVAINWNDIL